MVLIPKVPISSGLVAKKEPWNLEILWCLTTKTDCTVCNGFSNLNIFFAGVVIATVLVNVGKIAPVAIGPKWPLRLITLCKKVRFLIYKGLVKSSLQRSVTFPFSHRFLLIMQKKRRPASRSIQPGAKLNLTFF